VEEWQTKKENVSYGKTVSSQCFRAPQQRRDLIVGAPGQKDREFLTAHGSRAEKWEADRNPSCHFYPGSETLPDRLVRDRELGAQPAGSGRRVCERNIEKIRAIELGPEAAALVFREALHSGPPGIPAVIFRV
jgi:hypothetical protein